MTNRSPTTGRRELVWELVLVTPLYVGASIYFTWPLTQVLSSRFVGSPLLLMDLHLVTWILAWGTHALTTDPTLLFDGNVFHPTPNVVASSEHLLGVQPIFAPVYLATGNALLGHNVAVLASFVLCCVFMHLLIRSWTGSRLAAIAGSVAFAFAPWRLDLGRSHLLQVQYLPLVWLLLERVSATGSIRTGLLAGLVIGVQVLCSFYLGYLALVLAGTTVAIGVAAAVLRGRRVSLAALGAVGFTATACVVPVALPYLRAASVDVLKPMVVRASAPDALILSLVTAGTDTSAAILALAGATIALRWRRAPAAAQRALIAVVVALVSTGLAAGHTGLWSGRIAPLRWLAAIVPGLDYHRVPIRFAYLTSFAAAVLAALAIAALDRRVPARRALGLLARVGAVIATLGLGYRHLNVREAPVSGTPNPARVPAVYEWIAQHGENDPVLELPIGPPRSFQARLLAAQAMHSSTYHWHPLLNGYTGFYPPSYELVASWAGQLPSRSAVDTLAKATGLRWVVAHRAPPTDSYHAAGLVHRMSFPDGRGGEDHLYEVIGGPAARNHRWISNPRETVDGAVAVPITESTGTLRGELRGAARARRPLPVRFTVQNQGSQLWPTTSIGRDLRLALHGHWRDAAGNQVRPFTVVLPSDLPAGDTLVFDTSVPVPARPGSYTLQAELRQLATKIRMPHWHAAVAVVTSP